MAVVKPPIREELVKTYLIQTAKSYFPECNPTVTYTPNPDNPTRDGTFRMNFVLNSDTSGKLQSDFVSHLEWVFGRKDKKTVVCAKDAGGLFSCVLGGKPFLLFAAIRKNDPKNLPKTEIER